MKQLYILSFFFNITCKSTSIYCTRDTGKGSKLHLPQSFNGLSRQLVEIFYGLKYFKLIYFLQVSNNTTVFAM